MRASAKRQEPEIVYRSGKPAAVILGIEEYRELLERLEDEEDLKLLRKLRSRPVKYLPLDTVIKELRRRSVEQALA